ncbi:hypothetical protein Tco_0784928 [Tanacetum coccineum]
MKRKKAHNQSSHSDSFLDEAFNDILLYIRNLDANRMEIVTPLSHYSHQFYTLSMSNDIGLIDKKKYRREVIIRWKNKRCNTNTHYTSNETNTLFLTNKPLEQVGPSNQSSFILNDEIPDNEETKNVLEEEECRNLAEKTTSMLNDRKRVVAVHSVDG